MVGNGRSYGILLLRGYFGPDGSSLRVYRFPLAQKAGKDYPAAGQRISWPARISFAPTPLQGVGASIFCKFAKYRFFLYS